MNLKLFLFFLFLSIDTFIFIGCGGDSNDEAKTEERHEKHESVTIPVSTATDIGLTLINVETKPLNVVLTAPAKVLTNQNLEAHVGSLVPGRVHQIFAKVGDFVTSKQVLMTVEGLDVGAIQAGFLKAKAALVFWKASYERQKKLFDEKIGSQKSLLESQAEYEKALAEFRAEDKRIHSVGLDDDDVTMGMNGDEHTSGTLPIKSHISGIVVERNVVVGQSIDATTSAFRVINTQSVWIDGQIYEKDLAKIHRMTTTHFTTTTFPNVKFSGQIIYIGQTVDEHSRTITIRGEFNNVQNMLKPFMFGELKIPIGMDANAIIIPDEAVVKEPGEEYVFVQFNDTTYKKRKIVAGISLQNGIEIKDGLKLGEKVVTKGVFYLKSELKKDEIAGDEH
ncbi:MAG: efflux RND transporter periplasmic adaptor subunit [bacterium]